MAINKLSSIMWYSYRWLKGEESTCQCRRHGFNPQVWKIPWRRKWQPTPVFLPGKSHRQRCLVGYSPRDYEGVRHNLATEPNWTEGDAPERRCGRGVSEGVKVAQLCSTLCDPMDYTVHEILQARILGWVAVPFSRGSSQPRDQIQVSCTVGGFFTSWAIRETQEYWSG